MLSKKKIAIIVPGLKNGGGVPAMGNFLYSIIKNSPDFDPDLISIATSSSDKASLLFSSPKTWYRYPKIFNETWQGKPYKHVGCFGADIEFFRYLRNKTLAKLLTQYHLLIVVGGAPIFGFGLRHISKPKFLTMATSYRQDRESYMNHVYGIKKYWLKFMMRLSPFFERYSLVSMDHIFLQSHYAYNLIKNIVPNNFLSLGVPGVNTDVFFSSQYCTNGYILSVARFADPRKNVRLLFTAYHKLCQNLNNVPNLVLAGKHLPNEDDWKFAINLNISNKITLINNPSQEELSKIYKGASIFVLSSNEEGLGIVLIEAMASGIPVISTACGGPETIISNNHNGFLVPVDNSETLASKMQILLEDITLRLRFRQEGLLTIQTRFSYKAAGKAYLDKFRELT
jgi:glycosyltransferase involved in cell wall biosynthesis